MKPKTASKYTSKESTLNSIRYCSQYVLKDRNKRTPAKHAAWRNKSYEHFFDHRHKIFWGGWLENEGKDIDFPDPTKFPNQPVRISPALFPMDSPLRGLIAPITPMEQNANRAIQDSNMAMQQFLMDKDRQRRIRELKSNYLLNR